MRRSNGPGGGGNPTPLNPLGAHLGWGDGPTVGTGEVRAGGGVVWRRGGDGDFDVVLVHRARIRRLEPAQRQGRGGASPRRRPRLREVEEETGLTCPARSGAGPRRPITIAFDRPQAWSATWAMTPVAGQAAGHHEGRPGGLAATRRGPSPAELRPATGRSSTGLPRRPAEGPAASPVGVRLWPDGHTQMLGRQEGG